MTAKQLRATSISPKSLATAWMSRRTVILPESVVLKEALPFAAADESWDVATDLAEAIARTGTRFHSAHQIVGRLVLESVRAGKTPASPNTESLAKFAPEFTPDVARLL